MLEELEGFFEEETFELLSIDEVDSTSLLSISSGSVSLDVPSSLGISEDGTEGIVGSLETSGTEGTDDEEEEDGSTGGTTGSSAKATKEIDKLIRRLEREIEKQESVVSELEAKIETSGADYQEWTRLLGEKEEAELVLMDLMEQWETAQQSVEG